MKRFEIGAHIINPATELRHAVATTTEKKEGRYVRYADVEGLIEKAEYWEAEFRKEFGRVKDLCDLRDRARSALKKIQEELL